VTATTATAGTPIPMPAGINYGDLASCNAGNPLAVKDLPDETDFHIYPNPATDEITISCREPGKFDYRILNVNGSSERLISGNGGTLKLDIRLLPAGVYFIETTYSKGILRKKFVKL
jgi:hypothetical protein